MDIKDDTPEKSQIYREHMERVRVQKASEEEALKYSRTIKGADLTNYKNRKHKYRKYVSSVEQDLLDRRKLRLIRSFQFLTGLMGLAGTGMIFLNVRDWMSYIAIIEMNLMWLTGCALTTFGIMAIIGFQYRHDKISDRINARYSTRIETDAIGRRSNSAHGKN
jgi:hypothetical protein